MGCSSSNSTEEKKEEGAVAEQKNAEGTKSTSDIAPKDDKGTFKAKDWKKLMEKMPIDKTEDAAKQRKKIWDEMNAHSNGDVSKKKMGKDMEKYLGIPKKVSEKGCLDLAYDNAKNKVKSKKLGSDDYIQFAEFRIFLVYLKQYFQYWVMFENMGGGKNMVLTLAQLKEAVPILESYGVKISDPDAEFKTMDKDGSGKISFDEFAKYAIAKELEIESDEDYDGKVLRQ